MTYRKAALWALAIATVLMLSPNVALGADVKDKTDRPKAEDNFRWYCVQCHGPRGDGKGVNNTRATKLPVSPRNLTDGKDIAQFSDEDITRTITHGGGVNDLSPIMPPWGNVFSKEEIQDLVAHVRKLCHCQFDPKAKERAMRQSGRIPPADRPSEKSDANGKPEQ